MALSSGIVLDDGEQRSQRAGQGVLRGGLLGRALGTGRDGGGAGVGDVGQDLLLEAHVALDRVHQVGDEVVAALQLHFDLGERLIDSQALLHQAVVQADEDDDEDDDDRADDQEFHAPPPVAVRRGHARLPQSIAGGHEGAAPGCSIGEWSTSWHTRS